MKKILEALSTLSIDELILARSELINHIDKLVVKKRREAFDSACERVNRRMTGG